MFADLLDLIRFTFKKTNLSIREVAKVTGVSEFVIQEIMKGSKKNAQLIESIIPIANYLKIEIKVK